MEGGNTRECLSLLKDTPDIDIAQLRAALLDCDSANALNTFNGLGFDGKNYTLPEFVVPNTGLMELQEAEIPCNNIVLIGDPGDTTPAVVVASNRDIEAEEMTTMSGSISLHGGAMNKMVQLIPMVLY